MAALLIDLDGVIYDDDGPIDGAADAVGWIVEQQIPHLFVTNTTSRPRSALVARLDDIGIAVDAERILTPPVAACGWLSRNAPGPAALFVAPATSSEFAELDIAEPGEDDVAAVVIGDYGERWDFDELNRAFRLLMAKPQPQLVALGMTRYWQASDGLRLDTAPFVVALSHASGAEPVVLGKPAAAFFETALSMLGESAAETVMIGDDIKGDVGGAQKLGISAALVKTGKFRAADLESDLRPDAVLESFADLPNQWNRLAGR